jgi:hypothetical protein
VRVASLAVCKFCEHSLDDLRIASRQQDISKSKNAVGDFILNYELCSWEYYDKTPLAVLLDKGPRGKMLDHPISD